MRFEITRTSPDGMTRQRWLFWLDVGLRLRLVEWEPLERKTKRHKWIRSGTGYHRRTSDFHCPGYTLAASEVPLPTDVREEAVQALFAQIMVIGAEDPPHLDDKPRRSGWSRV